MIKNLFNEEREYLDYFFDNVDMKAVEKVFEMALSCQGSLFFTGVGKSRIIAEKIAVTMVSTGTRAFFMQPTDALHGDIGALSHQDIFIALSKSGETEELLNLIPFIRNKGATIIAITSNEKSRLAKASDAHLFLPLKKELCPFDLAPTTSCALQLIVGDVLAIALMRVRNISLEEYALNHPAGRIGKRATVRVKDLMLTHERLPIAAEDERLGDKLVDFSDKRCGCLLIVSSTGELHSLFTDHDLRLALSQHGSLALEKKLGEISQPPQKTISQDKLAWEAMRLMEEDQKRPISVLPVVDDKNQLLGLIRLHDLIQAGL